MRAIGQRSVASVLERLLSVAWYGVVLALLAASFVGLLPLWWDVSSLEAKSHLTMDIPVALRLDAQPLRATAPGLGIAEVALLLGYSEQSAFTRAFKRWTGVTPKAFRRDLAAP